MAKEQKRQIRDDFRVAVFTRDGHRCRVCGRPASADWPLDAHHITDRNELPNGGYVAENGISLCSSCHASAEQLHATGTAEIGYSPDDLYKLIGSSWVQAWEESEKLAPGD